MRDFCVECRKEVEYIVSKSLCKKVIKGYEIEYEKKEAICSECQHLIFVDKIHDENIESLKNAYHKKVSSEAIDIITSIMSKYNIGKRPLSLLLDFGEITITRYLEGSLPKKEYLDLLKKIEKDSNQFYEILEKNKDRITKMAYDKCLNKLNEMELKDSTVSFNSSDKIYKVVDYILYLSDDITPLALQKILYYCQAFFKVFYGYDLFENECEAWVHGPVYPEIYHRFKDYKYHQINSDFSEFKSGLDEKEQFFIGLIMRDFGCYSGKILERMTHCEKPWIETREGLSEHQKCRKVIDKSLIESYFVDVSKKYNMLGVADIGDYAKSLFNKVL